MRRAKRLLAALFVAAAGCSVKEPAGPATRPEAAWFESTTSRPIGAWSPHYPSRTISTGRGYTYPRAVRLPDSSLLLAHERHGSTGMVMPVYKSTDDGKTWALVSSVRDGSDYFVLQPHLYVLHKRAGDLAAGTVLLSGGTLNAALTEVYLPLFKSTNGGMSWEKVSVIAVGQGISMGQDPVWEPYLLQLDDGRLVCYYSDERDSQHAQCLVHVVSDDGGKTWGAVVKDIALVDSSLRPGMPIVTRLANGKYFFTYEGVGSDNTPTYCKISDDPLSFGDPALSGSAITSDDGVYSTNNPTTYWLDYGAPNGTLVVVSQSLRSSTGAVVTDEYLVNFNNGTGKWYRTPKAIRNTNPVYPGDGYSQSMIANASGTQLIQFCDVLQPSTERSIRCATAPIGCVAGRLYNGGFEDSGETVLSAHGARIR